MGLVPGALGVLGAGRRKAPTRRSCPVPVCKEMLLKQRPRHARSHRPLVSPASGATPPSGFSRLWGHTSACTTPGMGRLCRARVTSGSKSVIMCGPRSESGPGESPVEGETWPVTEAGPPEDRYSPRPFSNCLLAEPMGSSTGVRHSVSPLTPMRPGAAARGHSTVPSFLHWTLVRPHLGLRSQAARLAAAAGV